MVVLAPSSAALASLGGGRGNCDRPRTNQQYPGQSSGGSSPINSARILSCTSIHRFGRLGLSVCSLAKPRVETETTRPTRQKTSIYTVSSLSRNVLFHSHSNLRHGVQAATQLGCLHSSPDVPMVPRNGTATESVYPWNHVNGASERTIKFARVVPAGACR